MSRAKHFLFVHHISRGQVKDGNHWNIGNRPGGRGGFFVADVPLLPLHLNMWAKPFLQKFSRITQA